LNSRSDVIFTPQKVYLGWFWGYKYRYRPTPSLRPCHKDRATPSVAR